MRNKILRRGIIPVFAFLLLCTSWSCHWENKKVKNLKEPKGEGEEMEVKRKQYFELIHRADPQTDWKSIEIQNRQKIVSDKKLLLQKGTNQVTESFANGKITASWYEVGSNNIAGNIQGVDYLPATDNLYCISDGGTLWRSPRTSPNWTILNQQFRFSPRLINVMPKNGGGTKILTSADRNVYYSDNEGTNFTPATGISFPIGWGGNYVADIITLNDAQKTVYCLTRPWDPVPFAPRFWLYRSVDTGKTFSRIKVFDAIDDNRVTIWSPLGSDKLYAIETQNTGGSFVKLYSVSGATVSLLNSSADVPVNKESYLQGHYDGTNTLFYLLVNNNTTNTRQVYQSGNNGLNWSLQGSLTEVYYGGFAVSLTDPNKVFMGGVDLFRNFNGGVGAWTMVNSWQDYYHEHDKLHADIMRVKFFKTIANQEFAVINTHGGTYLSNDNIITTANISLSGHNTGQFYDVITHPANVGQIFVGTQDQGFQRRLGANVPITAPVSFTQVVSGDYGQLRLTDNANRLWTEYPGGEIFYYNRFDSLNVSSAWVLPGTNKPNFGWMLATANTTNATENAIYIGGGNTSGGAGSYLIKLTAATVAPFTITPTQINYDFRANSNNTTSGISSIATSSIDPNKIYVATEDGTFFFSNDNGSNWAKSAFTGIPGGFWLYGASILPSKLNANTVWYAGSGYSNPGVFRSTDGGVSFSPISNGLPSTLVHEIVANENETLLFAATEAGPYVYIVADNTWYSLHGTSTPVQDYFTVEYLPSTKTARFGTYGRGIWDFAIASIVPVKFESITASLLPGQDAAVIQWTVSEESNIALYNLQRSTDGTVFKTIASVTPSLGNGRKKYDITDKQLSQSLYYYRVQEVDRDGRTSLSKTVTVRVSVNEKYKIWPTIVTAGTPVTLQAPAGTTVLFRLFDISGRLVDNRTVQPGNQFYLAGQLAKGVYNYQLVSNQQVVAAGKLNVR